MEKLIFLTIFFICLFSEAQVKIDVIDNVKYKVWVSDTIYSNHNSQGNAIESFLNLKFSNPYADAIIVANGTISLKITGEDSLLPCPDCIETTNPELVILVESSISVILSGTSYFITIIPKDGFILPQGGYDTYIDGVDMNDNALYSSGTREIKGLDISKPHTFKIESRYTQFTPALFLPSNTITVSGKNLTSGEVVTTDTTSFAYFYSAQRIMDAYELKFHLPDGSAIPQGGYDTFVDGVNLNDNSLHTGFIRIIEGLDTTVEHCFELQIRHTQYANPMFLMTNKLCVKP
jgi:hypothetical protein